jgi:uncharacterized protein DUF1549/uncharacterized protein DUF1553
MITGTRRLYGWVGVCALLASTHAFAETVRPLHERIDGLIESAALGPLSPLTDDSEFLRRVSLDLTGVIPTPAEVRAFVADRAANKRPVAIDRMLASPKFARQMAIVFDVMFTERRPSKNKTISAADWQEYLRSSFATGKSYDQLVREILSADGTTGPLKPAANFYFSRSCEPNSLTRDIGRFFFGMDMQCAQCHDHPLVDDYYQADYYGLYAFVTRVQLYEDRKAKFSQISEKADGEANFKSVFTGFSMDKVTPRLPQGQSYVDPPIEKGQEYLVKPEKNAAGVPRFSRRLELAKVVAAGENAAFNRNIANRLWAQMLGRGLVHPVDFHHSDNPPSHPELLELLATEIRHLHYDVAAFLREIALSRTYQRSCQPPSATSWQASSLAAKLSALEQADATCRKALHAAEQASQPLDQATAAEKKKLPVVTVSTAKRRKPAAVNASVLAEAKTAAAQSAARLAEARSLLEYARLAKSDSTAAARQWDSLVDGWAARGYTATLKPLSAEQFAMSWLQATGSLAKTEAAVKVALDKAPPEELKKASAADRPRVLAALIERRTFDQIRGTVDAFVNLYGSALGQDFQATMNQALFLGNGNLAEGLLKPAGDNLVGRLDKMTNANDLADELYLATLGRFPSADERTIVTAYLKDRSKDRALAIGEMAWALLASNEFRFNH